MTLWAGGEGRVPLLARSTREQPGSAAVTAAGCGRGRIAAALLGTRVASAVQGVFSILWTGGGRTWKSSRFSRRENETTSSRNAKVVLRLVVIVEKESHMRADRTIVWIAVSAAVVLALAPITGTAQLFRRRLAPPVIMNEPAPVAVPAQPAQVQATQPATAVQPSQPTEAMAIQAGQGQVIRGSQLIGLAVFDSSRQKLGIIRDLLVDSGTGQISFVVIGAQGAGAAAELFVAPYDVLALNVNAQDHRDFFVLNMAPAQLQRAPRIEAGRWEVINTPQFLGQARQFFRGVQRTAAYGTRAGEAGGEMRQNQPQNAAPTEPRPEIRNNEGRPGEMRGNESGRGQPRMNDSRNDSRTNQPLNELRRENTPSQPQGRPSQGTDSRVKTPPAPPSPQPAINR
jgi:hypothetical protein